MRGLVEGEGGPRPVYRRGHVDLDEPPVEYIRGPSLTIRPSGGRHGRDSGGQSQSLHEDGGYRRGSVMVELPAVEGGDDGYAPDPDFPDQDGQQPQALPYQSRQDPKPAVGRRFPSPPGFEPGYHTDEYQSPFAFGTRNTGE